MIIKVPDELCEKLMDGKPLTPNGIQDLVVKMVKKALDSGLDKECLVLSPEQLETLREIYGVISGSEELMEKIRRLGTVRVQGKEYLLNAEQMKRLRQEAFFNRNPGEPRSEQECKTKEQAEKIVSRYTLRQIDYFMKQMCSQI